MVGLVERRMSKSAIWCRRLALFALPYFLLTIFAHRFGNITAPQAIGLLAFGFMILVFSIILAVQATVQFWNDGAKGGKLMISGLLLSSLMMAPFLVFGALAVGYPALNDISTNVYSLPVFSDKVLNLRRATGVEQSYDTAITYDDEDIAAIQATYPKISPRRYPAGPERVLKAIKEIIADRGWNTLGVRGLPNNDATTQAESDGQIKTTSSQNTEPDNGLETAALGDIYLDVVSLSRVFSFKNDVVIQIITEDQNTLVEMRSAARWGTHDFGANARVIEDFLADLDQSLLGIAGEG